MYQLKKWNHSLKPSGKLKAVIITWTILIDRASPIPALGTSDRAKTLFPNLSTIKYFSSEMERRKAEVRARLIEQSQSKKKKGFMTPERKKKLRVSGT